MRAYIIATRLTNEGKKIKEREIEKIAIPELFDMIAGSETGAIIGSFLSIANDDIKNKDV